MPDREREPPPEPGPPTRIPPHIAYYPAVDDVDRRTKAATANGAHLVRPAPPWAPFITTPAWGKNLWLITAAYALRTAVKYAWPAERPAFGRTGPHGTAVVRLRSVYR